MDIHDTSLSVLYSRHRLALITIGICRERLEEGTAFCEFGLPTPTHRKSLLCPTLYSIAHLKMIQIARAALGRGRMNNPCSDILSRVKHW